MEYRNTSDLIEAFLKEKLLHAQEVEIRRSELARHFDCVPSQINYVMNTRFTLQQGYKVKSKRGGGGYIRISKINSMHSFRELKGFDFYIPANLSESEALFFLDKLKEKNGLSKKEWLLLKYLISHETLHSLEKEEKVRSVLIIGILNKFIVDGQE